MSLAPGLWDETLGDVLAVGRESVHVRRHAPAGGRSALLRDEGHRREDPEAVQGCVLREAKFLRDLRRARLWANLEKPQDLHLRPVEGFRGLAFRQSRLELESLVHALPPLRGRGR